MKPPHLVVIMADQLRHDLIGPEHTPNIAALATESAVFPNTYCASPICVPARGAFFTGRYPNQTGCLINPWIKADMRHGHVAEGTPNLYGLLGEGWDCWHTGKQHLSYAPPLERRPGPVHWITLEDTYAPMLAARGHTPPGGARFRAGYVARPLRETAPDDVAGFRRRRQTLADPLKDGAGRELHDADKDRQALGALRDQAAVHGRIDPVRAVVGLGDDGGEGGAREGEVHLVADLLKARLDHGQCDGVDHAATSTIRFPSASWVTRAPGSMTMVVSICSIIAGPCRSIFTGRWSRQ